MIPETRSSKLGKQATNAMALNCQKVKKIICSHVPQDDPINGRPRTNALFKAIRGQGNRLHGWYLNVS